MALLVCRSGHLEAWQSQQCRNYQPTCRVRGAWRGRFARSALVQCQHRDSNRRANSCARTALTESLPQEELVVFLCQARNVRQNRPRCHLHPCLHHSVQTLQFSDCAICRHQEKKVRPLPKFGEHRKSTPRSEQLEERLCECSTCARICSSIGTVYLCLQLTPRLCCPLFFCFFLAARHPADIDGVSCRWCPGTDHVIFEDKVSVPLRASIELQSAVLALVSIFS